MDLVAVFKDAKVLDRTDSGGFSGYASTFHTLDFHGDIIAKGAFSWDIERFLKKGFVGGSNHDHKNPVGRFVEAYEDDTGLWVDATLTASAKAQEVRNDILDGVITSMSVGLIPLQARKLTRDEVLKYWEAADYEPSEVEMAFAQKGARLIKRARLLEVSPVALPANERAEILVAKSMDFKAGRRFSRASLEQITAYLGQVQSALAELQGFLVDSGQVADHSDDPAESLESSKEESAETPSEEWLELSNKLASFERLLGA